MNVITSYSIHYTKLYEVAVSLRIAGIPQVERPDVQASMPGRQQQAAQRRGAAGIVVIDPGIEVLDAPAGRRVLRARRVILEIVRNNFV